MLVDLTQASRKSLAGARLPSHKLGRVEVTHITGGTEWLVDAFGCDPARLRDVSILVELGATLIATLELNVIGAPLLHRFEGAGGATGLYLLSESHLAWHTYPESALCTLNLYCCRARPVLDWGDLLRRTLGAQHVLVSVVRRGLTGPPP